MQNGGWASFDKDNDKMVFQYIPFADHNAMLDPPTVDITGRILEMMATYGYDKNHPAVKRAIQFIRNEQEPDGSWFGRWGVNYIYGTALVLRGLEAIGMDNHEPCLQQAAEWLRMVQNPDGGWAKASAPMTIQLCAASATAPLRKPPGQFLASSRSAILAAIQ